MKLAIFGGEREIGEKVSDIYQWSDTEVEKSKHAIYLKPKTGQTFDLVKQEMKSK